MRQEKIADPHYRIFAGDAASLGRSPAPHLFLYRHGLAGAIRQSAPDLVDMYTKRPTR